MSPSRTRSAIIISIILALVLLGGLSWYFGQKQNQQKNNITSNTTQNQSVANNVSVNLSQQENLTEDNRSNPSFIQMPDGFKIQESATGLGEVRYLAKFKDGILASIDDQSKVVALLDNDENGTFETKIDFITGLNHPNGIDVYNDFVYIAESDKIFRVTDQDQNYKADQNSRQDLVNLPNGGNHFRRTVKIINDKMYISIGSSCNSCMEKNEQRASVLQCLPDGQDCKVYATGLRNATEIISYNKRIIVTEVGRDNLGDNIPPEEINVLEEGAFYGWPYCYSQRVLDTTISDDQKKCDASVAPWIELPAHSTPLGLISLSESFFPNEYKTQFLVSAHGSWNRSQPDGYKIYRVDPSTKKYYDFAVGWLGEENTKLGRPVHLLSYEGNVLVSDDLAGKIYTIAYSK